MNPLRAAVLRDFNVDLPLGSGNGSRKEPFQILRPEKGSNDYVSAMHAVVKFWCLGSGAASWDFLENVTFEEDGRTIDSLLYEIVFEKDDEVITEKRRWYFDITEVFRRRA